MSFRITKTTSLIANQKTRFPFRYGIASLTAVPHLFLRITVETDAGSATGTASENIVPKWFTKVAERPFKEEITELFMVIERALEYGLAAPSERSFFDWWRHLSEAQSAWGAAEGLQPLLTNFGTSMVERAVFDALCQIWGLSFGEALRQNRFGIQLGELRPALRGLEPGDLLPASPPRFIKARHTVGLGDALTTAELDPAERVNDGLPQSLEEVIARYGISQLKVKLCGDIARDTERLLTLQRLLAASDQDVGFTLDGNEQYTEVAAFRDVWEALIADPRLSEFLQRLWFVEQPFHRDIALNPGTGETLRAWVDRPPMIIDESDGELESMPTALANGYVGTSHKNCKGVMKGILNACDLAARRAAGQTGLVMSGEDLTNLAPVALMQDLAVAASLGIDNVERNGHHYFRGLERFPTALQEAALAAHPDLLERGPIEAPSVRIDAGRLDCSTVLAAPFGYGFEFPEAGLTPLKAWDYASLGM